MDTIESLIEEWERQFGRQAFRIKSLEAFRTAANASPSNGDAAKLMDAILRKADPETLTRLWNEWKAAGRQDIELRIRQEAERRKRRSSITR